MSNFNSGKMTPSRIAFNTDVKKYIPKKTLVVLVPEKDVEALRLLIDSCKDELPTTLAEFLENVRKQLG